MLPISSSRLNISFTGAFVPAFLMYCAVWCACWFKWRFGMGEWLGSAGGCFAFAVVAGLLLGGRKALPLAFVALFIGHSAGYFLGGPIHYSLKEYRVLGILGWGLVYGLGFGAGIGFAFHAFQKARSVDSAPAA